MISPYRMSTGKKPRLPLGKGKKAAAAAVDHRPMEEEEDEEDQHHPHHQHEEAKAGPLDAVEYRVTFRSPGTPGNEVGEPVAGHVRTILAICHFADVSRSQLDPLLVALASLIRKDALTMARASAASAKAMTSCPRLACRFCLAPNALVVRDYLCVCEHCGYENDNIMVQDDVHHLPHGKATCGTPADSRMLDATYREFHSSLRAVEQRVHAIAVHGTFLNLAQEIRAAQIAHLYLVDQGLRTRRKTGEIAVACCVFVLLETWASILVPIKVFRNDAWTTQWVLPAQTTTTTTKTRTRTKSKN